jgi:amino acid adenylation domain-containing protein
MTIMRQPLEDFLAALRQREIILWVDNDRLLYRAAKDAMTPDLLAKLKERKAEILEFMHQAKLHAHPNNQSQIVPIERLGRLPISFNQQRLWLLEQFDPGKSVYNLPLAYQFKGTLDIDVLHHCLKEIVRRHEVFRSTFYVDNDEPYQTIASEIEVMLPIIDFQHLPEDEREAEAKKVATAEAKKPFDLEKGPLFRFELLRLNTTEHVLVYNTHHIISDGWSSEVFFKELTALYAAFSSNQASPLSELPVQYVDHAAWQRRWLQGEVLQKQLDYWKENLGSDLPILQLPTDHPRPAVTSYRGEIGRKMLPVSLTDKLRTISQKGNATLSMILMTAFKVLLYRYSGQEDIIVGSPVAGRNQLESESLIGFFVNTIAFRTDLSGNPTFRELLERVRLVSLNAYANQDVPFDKLVQAIQPERDPSRSPIFQVMFGMNAPWTEGNSRQLTNVTISSTFGYVHNSSSSFDLTLVMRDTGKGLRVSVEYSLDLFEDDTIERMIDHFQTLLEGIAANPDQPISELPLLNEGEQHKVLKKWNQTQVEYPSTACLHQLIEAQAEKTPDAIAVIAGNSHLTYRDLNTRANQLAHVLQKQGVGVDVPVALYVERSLEFTIGVLGTLKAGGAYIPISPIMPTDRRLDILQDAQPPVILTQSHLIPSLPVDHDINIIVLDSNVEQIASQPSSNPLCHTTPDNLAYIIYTSGSTGKPKGVAITHGGVVNHGVATAKLFELTSQDRVLQFSNISFDICIEEVFPTWLSGATLILRSEEIASSTSKFLEFLDHHQITVANLPTAFWHELVNGLSSLSPLIPESLRLVVVGGEKASYSAYKTWVLHVGTYPRWLNTYGPTETTVTATVYDPATDAELLSSRTELPIGKPLDNVQAYILNANLQPTPIGVAGDLFIGGAGLAKGYLNRPELTAKVFIEHSFYTEQNRRTATKIRLYRTGDRARYLADGNIEFLGRQDNQVKIRGFRIELGEIESTLAMHPNVAQSVVMVRESTSGQKQLIAYVVVDPQKTFEISAIRDFLKEKLPAYMVPAHFVQIDIVPLTTNGKINYRGLPEPDLSSSTMLPEHAIARDDFERKLTRIWKETLGTQAIGIQDNFFDLGGHSLLAVRLFTLIEKQFGRNLPLATLLQAPTIELMAEVIRLGQETKAWSPLVAIKPQGSKPPLFCVHGGGFNVLIYRSLALNLPSDQPVYGLQGKGLDGNIPMQLQFESIAADYIEEIQTIQPKGPYFLAGLSNGGNIALEMAQQLYAQGESVGNLFLFDTYGPDSIELLPSFPRFLSSLRYAATYSIPRFLERLQESGSTVLVKEIQQYLNQLSQQKNNQRLSELKRITHHQSGQPPILAENRWNLLMNKISQHILTRSPWAFFNPSAQLHDMDGEISDTLRRLEVVYEKAERDYEVKPYHGRITIFSAKESPPGFKIDPQMGWGAVAKDGVEVHTIEGHHTSILNSTVLAQTIADGIEKAVQISHQDSETANKLKTVTVKNG